MDLQTIGVFQVHTFTGLTITFRVLEDYTIEDDFFGLGPISSIDLKPIIIIRTMDGHDIDFDSYARTNRRKREYIEKVTIDDELLRELVAKRKIYYSTDMAYLYGFDPELAYDRRESSRAFKHVKDPNKILALQKQGIYN